MFEKYGKTLFFTMTIISGTLLADSCPLSWEAYGTKFLVSPGSPAKAPVIGNPYNVGMYQNSVYNLKCSFTCGLEGGTTTFATKAYVDFKYIRGTTGYSASINADQVRTEANLMCNGIKWFSFAAQADLNWAQKWCLGTQACAWFPLSLCGVNINPSFKLVVSNPLTCTIDGFAGGD